MRQPLIPDVSYSIEITETTASAWPNRAYPEGQEENLCTAKWPASQVLSIYCVAIGNERAEKS